jgi:hypothetical protein
VGIVEDDTVAALSGAAATSGGGQLEPRLVVFDLCFAELNHGEAVAPQGLIGWATDQANHLVVVAGGNAVGVAERHVAHVGHIHRTPLPGGPEHVREQALHEARRDVDQQSLEIAERHCLEVQADRLEWPALDELPALGLKRVPEVAYELDEATTARLLTSEPVSVSAGPFPLPRVLLCLV